MDPLVIVDPAKQAIADFSQGQQYIRNAITPNSQLISSNPKMQPNGISLNFPP